MNPRYLLALASFIAFLQIKSQNLEVRYFSGSIEDSIQVMESLETIRQIYSRQQYDSVIHACQNILEISNEIQFTRGKGEAYFLKGRAFNRLSYKYKALEMYKLAFEHFQLLNDHIRLASTLNNWGITLKSIGNFREAIQTGEKALEHAILASSDKLRFHILNNLGTSYRNLALFMKAGSAYFESLSVLESEPDSLYRKQMQAEVYINLGLVYNEQKLYDKSKQILNSAKEILETQNLKPQLATVYNNLAVVYTDTKDFNMAWKYLVLADSLNTEINNKIGIAICKNNLGRFYKEKKMYSTAIDKHQQAIAKLSELNAVSYLSYCYLGLGKTQMAAEMLRESHLSLLKGLQIALKSGQKVAELMLYESLIELHKSAEELEETIMFYELHAALSQELNDQQIGRHIGQLELEELINKRDSALKVLESEAALLEFQISKRNLLLALSIIVILLLSGVFTLILRQHRLKAISRSIELEQKILRTQLNPHFIFNALGAIQHYMLDHAPEKAASYLSKFSTVMRSILESSRTSKTSLSLELENIRNYLDLQSLRFSGTFKYCIHLDPEIRPEMVEIPSLLLQPLLENSIEHGLLPNNGGELIITAKQMDKDLIIEITDNGVGLQRRKIVKSSKRKKLSLGNTITSERIALINRGNKSKIRFNLVSIPNVDNTSGTKASLQIPLK